MELDFYLDAGIGNLEPQQNIYADQDGPILVNYEQGVKLKKGRWGLPPFRERDAKGRRERPRNNIRKVDFWQQRYPDVILNKEHRCLVPFSAFAEPVRDSTWFSVVNEEVAFFAGVCMAWSGERLKAQPQQKRRKRENDDWLLYAFLTTEANSIVAPVHPDAMPVVLTDPHACRKWLAGGAESLSLQKPLNADFLDIHEIDK